MIKAFPAMPNIGFTICHLASFSLGFPEPEGHLYFSPPRASAPHAYLSDVFTKQLEDSKQVFLNDRTAENAWDFYYNYNILYELRCKGESIFENVES